MNKIFKTFKTGLALGIALAFTGTAAAAGPAIEDLDGFYQLTADLSNYQSNQYSNADGTFVFQISVYNGSANVLGFMGGSYQQDPMNLQPSITGGFESAIATSYDQSTGQLKIQNYYGNSFAGYVGMQVGEWGGFKTAPNSPFIMTFNEDGTISMTNFNFIKFTGTTVDETYGKYSNISIQPYTPPASTGLAIEGNWTFTKQAVGSSTTEQANYVVTANGNTITFEEQNEFGDGPYFKATLGSDGTTLTFSGQALTGAVTQKAFTNGDASSTSSLNDAGFTATYDESAGTITFPANCGIQLLTNGSETLINGETYAYNLVSATQISGLDPVLLLQKPQYTTTPETITAQFTMAYQNLDLSKVASWGVYVEQAMPTADSGEDSETFSQVDGCTVSVEGDIATITIPVIQRSYYSYRVTLTGYNAEGGTIVSSKAAALAVNMTETIEITQVNTSVNGFDITYKVYALELAGIPADATYKMTYVPYKDAHPGNEDDDPDYETNAQYVDASYADRYFTATITVDEPGTYDYAFAFIAYDADGEEITRSNYRDALVTIADPTAPAIKISNATYTLEPEGETLNITVNFNTELANIELDDVAEFLGTFQFQLNTVEAECEVGENGATTATLLEMPEGQYTVSFNVTALDAEGEEIAASEWLDLKIDTSATGISLLTGGNGNARYFDLSGREVKNPAKGGIYIINGKKVVIR